MKPDFAPVWWYAAMVAIAAAGIFQLIDQPSMIALTVAFLVIGRQTRGACRAAR